LVCRLSWYIDEAGKSTKSAKLTKLVRQVSWYVYNDYWLSQLRWLLLTKKVDKILILTKLASNECISHFFWKQIMISQTKQISMHLVMCLWLLSLRLYFDCKVYFSWRLFQLFYVGKTNCYTKLFMTHWFPAETPNLTSACTLYLF